MSNYTKQDLIAYRKHLQERKEWNLRDADFTFEAIRYAIKTILEDDNCYRNSDDRNLEMMHFTHADKILELASKYRDTVIDNSQDE